jgi:dienelactone hydrolase
MRSGEFLKTCSHWLERDDLSSEFMRLLGSVPDASPDIGECLAAAQRIDIDDENSWHREWAVMAHQAGQVAESAISRGCAETAMAGWLRAIAYYQAAAFPFEGDDSRAQAMVARMRTCARAFLHCRDPQGEVVMIPWRADYPLQGYFLPARGEAGEAPAVLCVSEPGQRKESCLPKLAHLAMERGLSLLVVDLLGADSGEGFADIVGSRELESAIGCAMDYLTDRDDVDEHRIAILADEWGSSFVARGIALDRRYAAAVCDAGLWDMQERAFLAGYSAAAGAAIDIGRSTSRVARRIMCPVLVALREQGWLQPDHVARLVAEMKQDHPDITLKLFAGEQGGADNPAPGNAFVFDWIAARLSKARRLWS